MKNFKPQDEHFNNLSSLLEACKTKYTLPFKQACQMLKCSRSWAQNYIRPYVPCIYLRNGIRGDVQKGINYAKLISQQCGRTSNESIYLDKNAFNEYIFHSIVSCQKRSKRVCASYFMKPDQYRNYLFNLLKLRFKTYTYNVYECGNYDEYMQLLKEISELYRQYIDEDILQVIGTPTSRFKRTDSEYIDVPIPDTPIESWKAVHDLMDYGDIEETIYRQLYQNGCLRIELRLPDKNGEIKSAGKIYYILDPEPIVSQTIPENLLQECQRKYDYSFLNWYFNISKYTDSYCPAVQNAYSNDDTLVIAQSNWQSYCKKFKKDFRY